MGLPYSLLIRKLCCLFWDKFVCLLFLCVCVFSSDLILQLLHILTISLFLYLICVLLCFLYFQLITFITLSILSWIHCTKKMIKTRQLLLHRQRTITTNHQITPFPTSIPLLLLTCTEICDLAYRLCHVWPTMFRDRVPLSPSLVVMHHFPHYPGTEIVNELVMPCTISPPTRWTATAIATAGVASPTGSPLALGQSKRWTAAAAAAAAAVTVRRRERPGAPGPAMRSTTKTSRTVSLATSILQRPASRTSSNPPRPLYIVVVLVVVSSRQRTPAAGPVSSWATAGTCRRRRWPHGTALNDRRKTWWHALRRLWCKIFSCLIFFIFHSASFEDQESFNHTLLIAGKWAFFTSFLQHSLYQYHETDQLSPVKTAEEH